MRQTRTKVGRVPSRILGYHVLVTTSGGRRPSDTVHNAPRVLREYLRPFSFKAVCGRAANLTAIRGKSRREFSARLAELGLESALEFRPFLIRRVIAAAAEACSPDDLAGKAMNAAELRHALLIAEDIHSLADRQTHSRDTRTSAFLRMQQAAIHDQVDSSYVFREMSASLDVVARCRSAGLDLDAVFERTYGMTYRRLLLACLAFWGKVTTDRQEGFYLPPNQTGDLGVGINPEAILKFMSVDRAGFRAEMSRLAIPGFEPYSLSPLKNFPVITHSDGERSIPVADDLLDRPLRPFFYDVVSVLDRREEGIFGDALGSVFADYVYQSLVASVR